ncbi:MAG: S-adenosylmethionine:tRNA ribosyltransferase-isomerase, partial [Leptospiraceae bacterium]|nr:S-adenosylmethionine:tRNA ribosyltransferase-isomerase [Leptospiraceae bacterium]
MKVSDSLSEIQSRFSFDLPDELIARHPLPERDQSRLMVLRPGQTPEHRRFYELPDILDASDMLVWNDSRVE